MKEAEEMIGGLQAENKKKQRRIEKMEFIVQKRDEKINELLIKADNMEQKEYDRDCADCGACRNKDGKRWSQEYAETDKTKDGHQIEDNWHEVHSPSG